MDEIVVGISTLLDRSEFFENKTLPSLADHADEVYVYHDDTMCPEEEAWLDNVTHFYDYRPPPGDAGKFFGWAARRDRDFYYFSCDDDLIYPSDYFLKMIEWIEFFERKAVVSLHGSVFREFPIVSYYRERTNFACLQDLHAPRKVLFPGTGVTAFHSSTLEFPGMNYFRTRNMADVWFGMLLQKQGVPAVCLPHKGDYLTYNHDLPIENTIWGAEHRNDFVQTALINQFSLDHGFHLRGYPVPLEGPHSSLPLPLGLASPLPQQE